MKLIDNFEAFGFEFKEGEFYFIQILDRSHSGGSNKTRMIKSYFIDNQEFFDKKKPEMIKIANATGARIYCHPARRSKMKMALELIAYTAKCVNFGEVDRLSRGYETVCGRNFGTKKMWIVDVDSTDATDLNIAIQHIKTLKPFRDPMKILPTVHGYHLIYDGGFDRSNYTIKWDIHTNNPTLLYANCE